MMIEVVVLEQKIKPKVRKECALFEKRKKIIDWDLLDRCYADEHREFHYFVMDYLVAMQKFLKFDDVPHIKNISKQINGGTQYDIVNIS